MSDGNGGAPSGDAGQSTQGDGGQQNGAGFDAGALTGQLESMSQGQNELRQTLAGLTEMFQQQNQPADEGAGFDPNAPIDLSFLDDEGYDRAAVEPVVNAMQERFQQAFQAQEQKIEQLKETFDTRFHEREQTEHIRDLIADIPELANPEKFNEALQISNDYATAHGLPAELAGNVAFVRLAYMAQQAGDAANAEGSEPDNAAHLEGGGGSGAAQSQTSAQDFANMLQGETRDGPILPF